MAGNICHVEIAVRDMAPARKFYGDLFGWTFPLAGDEYTVFKPAEGVGGGLALDKDHKPDGPICFYIYVDDIPATLARIAAAGGKAEQPKTEVTGYGFMATFRDPSGNLVALFSQK